MNPKMNRVFEQSLPKPLKEMFYSGIDKEYSKSLQLNTIKLNDQKFNSWKFEELLLSKEFIELIIKKIEEKYSDQRTKGESRNHFQTIKWKNLGKKIFLDHHAVFFMENQFNELYKIYLDQKDYIPYAYADERIDSRYILESIKVWYKHEFQEELSFQFNIKWETRFIRSFIGDNKSIIYRLLPAYLHHNFCKREHAILGLNNNQPLKFYHCLKDDGTTSCISDLIWKSTKATKEKEKILIGKLLFNEDLHKKSNSIPLPFSYEIQCRLVTKPFQPNEKFININSNLKRYVYWNILKDMEWKYNLFTCRR